METAQERELQERQQAWWPLDTTACSSSLDVSSGSNSCFLLEWDPQLWYFGLGVVGIAAAAGDPHDHTDEHELELFFPKCMESPASSEASTAVVADTGVPTAEDAAVMPEDQLDELLRNFWDAEEEAKEKSTTAAAATFLDDGFLAVSSASPVGSTLPEKTVARPQPEQQQQPPPSSSSSHCYVDPHASDAGVAQQRQTTRTSCSSKRSATPPQGQETDAWSSKRSRKAAAAASSGAGAGPSVVRVRPFTVVKPGGADGVATLADINERILTRPARPVRHPVGEFACAPRASGAGGHRQPAPSGKPVAGFTRVHTVGSGTITIVRTRG